MEDNSSLYFALIYDWCKREDLTPLTEKQNNIVRTYVEGLQRHWRDERERLLRESKDALFTRENTIENSVEVKNLKQNLNDYQNYICILEEKLLNIQNELRILGLNPQGAKELINLINRNFPCKVYNGILPNNMCSAEIAGKLK